MSDKTADQSNKDHLAVADAYHNLANVLRVQDLYNDAATYYRKARSIQMANQGVPTFIYLCSLVGLSMTYILQGLFDQAASLLREVKTGYRNLCQEKDDKSIDPSLEALMVCVSQSEAIIHNLRGNTNQANDMFVSTWRIYKRFVLEIILIHYILGPI